MLSKRQKTQNFVCSFVNGWGGGRFATGGSHFGLRRRALFITTFVFVKAKKNFFFCFLFSVGSQSLESPYSSHFQGRVPSELRLQGCRCPLGEISVLQPRGLWRWIPECPGGLWGSWPWGPPHPPEGSQVAVVPWLGSTELALLGLLPGPCGATGHPDRAAPPPRG